ncbi:Na/Pi cotransporter family protein [Clostridiaceae bacterium M8S5]|nr:Na/Pi cotransporter family protein [Clostridiaceae bacterium M8S5]
MLKLVFTVLGGLGLFLYGMNLMGMGLQKVAGDKLKKLIEILTNNKLMGVFVGVLVTMLIQSSSATTVMVVGFVNAGLMSLSQAIGIIMGANIGTTVTGQLIAFKLTDIAPLVIAIGVAIWLVSSKKKNKEIAEVLIGFGVLFLGMSMMSGALKPYAKSPVFIDIIKSLNNPFLGILVGFGITVLVQSSSASLGLLLAVASTTDLFTLNLAFPILFGQNIGTCVTAVLSSIGANKTAKKAAFMHLLFNIVGTGIFMIAIYVLPIQDWIKKLNPTDIERQIANAHTIFNIANTIILFPFAELIVRAANRVIPGEDDDDEVQGLKYLDQRIMETPPIAVGMASKEVLRMGKLVKKTLALSREAFFKSDEKLTHKVFEEEKKINWMEKSITNYLIELLNAPLTDSQHVIVTTLLNTVNDLERIGDHADNLAEFAQYRIDNKIKMSDYALKEIDIMFTKVQDSFERSLLAYKDPNEKIVASVISAEEDIDKMEKQLRANHIDRLNKQQCSGSSGIVFLDIISNLERIADHSSNIALAIRDALY